MRITVVWSLRMYQSGLSGKVSDETELEKVLWGKKPALADLIPAHLLVKEFPECKIS